MTKIEEIFKKYDVCIQPNYPPLRRMMKEYAEIYAKKVLEVAAKNAELLETDGDVDKDSILNIKLPEHE